MAIQSHAINRLCRNGEACFSDPPDLSSCCSSAPYDNTVDASFVIRWVPSCQVPVAPFMSIVRAGILATLISMILILIFDLYLATAYSVRGQMVESETAAGPPATGHQAPGRLPGFEAKKGKGQKPRKGQQQSLAYQTPDNNPSFYPFIPSSFVGAHSMMAKSICPLIERRCDASIRRVAARISAGLP